MSHSSSFEHAVFGVGVIAVADGVRGVAIAVTVADAIADGVRGVADAGTDGIRANGIFGVAILFIDIIADGLSPVLNFLRCKTRLKTNNAMVIMAEACTIGLLSITMGGGLDF